MHLSWIGRFLMLQRALSILLLFGVNQTVLASPNLDIVREILKTDSMPNISATPVAGTYEFSVGNDIFYLSEDGRYLIKGEMIDLHTRQNLAEARRQQNRLQRLQYINPSDMIIFPARGERHHVVYVFMDTDCPYCRMVQQDIYQYSQYGIEMRYLAFPRGGLNSPGYQRAISIWCAEDRVGAMIAAQEGQEIPERKCPTSVREQYATGLQIGVTGTPAMVLEDGTLVQGFMAPPNLAQFLKNHFARR